MTNKIAHHFNLILASRSPRRQELLHSLGFDFEIRVRPVDESFPDYLSMQEVALYLCEKKADAFNKGELAPNELVITDDKLRAVD